MHRPADRILIIPIASMIAVAAASLPAAAEARPEETTSAAPATRVATAARVENGAIKIDGILDEEEWEAGPAEGDFVQREPQSGIPASEPTVFTILYDDERIYVGVRAFDRDPRAIHRVLMRRDSEFESDWIHVFFDSYGDDRTAFGFGVNPGGTKVDQMIVEESTFEPNWDAVWDVAARMGESGWIAEFAIPFSQLRYASGREARDWGFQVKRTVSRTKEECYWSPLPRDTDRIVSFFGRLGGLEGIPAPRRFEVLPYALGSVDTYGDSGGSPFREDPRGGGRAGADLKCRLTTDLTLDAAINPDFGQVEQDPSEFNLTAYETYFSEKRPFFIEGSSIFHYRLDGGGGGEGLFYSRRIGRPPQLDPLASSRWSSTDRLQADVPKFTTILGAAKLTGKTSGGWSVGVLEALTDGENATVELPGGERVGVAVEPMTNYLVARAARDLRGGRSTLGGILTSVARDVDDPDMGILNRNAFTGGLDATHRWRRDELQLTAKVMGSWIEGSPEAMLAAQTSSAHYFQRPDADHIDVDSSATSLGGFAAFLSIGKFAGGHWNWFVDIMTRSPGFETNDLGYQQNADMSAIVTHAGYSRQKATERVRDWGFDTNWWHSRSYGWEGTDLGGDVNGWVEFMNGWGLAGGAYADISTLNPNILRGGPALRTPRGGSAWYEFHTDRRRRLALDCSGSFWHDARISHDLSVNPGITLRPASNLDLGLQLGFFSSDYDRQYVDAVDGRPIVARIDRRTFSITTRLNYTITPAMTLQLYAMPFVAAGAYTDFREVVSPRADRYEDRFAPFDYPTDPDFNFKELRSNIVFRWEYSPGSTVYLVWSRGATDFEPGYGRFRADRDLDRLLSTAGDNTFLLKISKWFSL